MGRNGGIPENDAGLVIIRLKAGFSTV